MTQKGNKLLLHPWAFPVLFALATAAILGGTHMFVVHRTGLFNGINATIMLNQGLVDGDFSVAAGYGAGFLLARLLEGPLVGIVDIGGGMMTGIGMGLAAMIMAAGGLFIFESFPLALLAGLIIGLVIGTGILLIRQVMSSGMSASGTDIMMGAGNSSGRWLGPLIILSAIQYGIGPGLGAFIGGAIFYKYDKPLAGGAILGAMILGILIPVK